MAGHTKGLGNGFVALAAGISVFASSIGLEVYREYDTRRRAETEEVRSAAREQILKRYDVNRNGVLDNDEITKLAQDIYIADNSLRRFLKYDQRDRPEQPKNE